MICVSALFNLKEEKREESTEALMSLIEPSRKDEGCILYNMHISAEDECQIMFYEQWQSQELLDQHLQTDHLKTALSSVDLKDDPTITMWSEPV